MREGLIIMSTFFKNQVFLRFNRIHTPSHTCLVTIKVRVGIICFKMRTMAEKMSSKLRCYEYVCTQS